MVSNLFLKKRSHPLRKCRSEGSMPRSCGIEIDRLRICLYLVLGWMRHPRVMVEELDPGA
jgi:hypothetical protein